LQRQNGAAKTPKRAIAKVQAIVTPWELRTGHALRRMNMPHRMHTTACGRKPISACSGFVRPHFDHSSGQ